MSAARHRLVAAIALFGFLGGAGLTGAAGQEPSGFPCSQEQTYARNSTGAYNDPDTRAFRRSVDKVVALFRFHRPVEARARLERASSQVTALVSTFRPEHRGELTRTFDALRSCLSSVRMDGLADLAVRVYDVVGRPEKAGVYVEVEGIRVGRTNALGEVRVRVPSGPTSVQVMAPPASWGEETLMISAGGSASVSVVLDDGKEFGYETDLSLIEAPRGVLDRASRTFVLRFTEGQRPVAMRRLSAVELLDERGDVDGDITQRFRLSRGAIAATNVPDLLARLPKDSLVRLRVAGEDGLGFLHVNRVEFRVR